MVLVVELTNVSEGQVFDPVAKTALRLNTVEDNFGNQLSALAPGLLEMDTYSFPGQESRELKPGEMLKTLFISEGSKVDNATKFVWTLYFRASNKDVINMFMPPRDRAVFVRFRKDDIRIIPDAE